jgi:hypothetical protein
MAKRTDVSQLKIGDKFYGVVHYEVTGIEVTAAKQCLFHPIKIVLHPTFGGGWYRRYRHVFVYGDLKRINHTSELGSSELSDWDINPR